MSADRQTFRIALFLAVILVSLTWLYFLIRPTPEIPVDYTPVIAVGEVAVEELVKLIGNSGTVVCIKPELAGVESPQVEAQVARFQETLKKHPGLRLTATEIIQFDPPETVSEGIPAEVYQGLLEKYGDTTAIVSFAGAPVTPPARLPAQRPRLVCFSSNLKALLALFERDVVQVAIISRLEAPPTMQKPTTDREKFDQSYQVLTRANAEQVLGPIFRR